MKLEMYSSGQVLNCLQPGDPRDQLVPVLMQRTEVSNLNKNMFDHHKSDSQGFKCLEQIGKLIHTMIS